MNGSPLRLPSDGPIPAELLADLQAGLLDDATAARVRLRVRTDPQAAATLAALDQVRRDLAELGQDADSAPPVPAEVTARITEVLRAEPGLPSARRWRLVAAAVGGCAVVVAAVLGVSMLLRPPGPARSTMTSLGQITVSPPRSAIGLSESQLLDLLSVPPELGPLADPRHRTACLAALGYPSGVRILGARPLDVAGSRGVLVLLPADTPDTVVALVVAADCDAGHAGLLADTMVKRPVNNP
ncbi:hypothetical protein M2272_002263 [Mycobacterium frederiksbergense]|uniref:Anti-sigma-M factor RsmA n=1 Tax=Mycolicibacterium frederiksbergense TaxID=117567 RepID=A0ABT6KY39_9MYCO|nr:hypothetical protein [Mycolicibacterium frederiksbergense]MDH6195623.1 hypothetical protein [Mycolicibacterium frederiksbergense]